MNSGHGEVAPASSLRVVGDVGRQASESRRDIAAEDHDLLSLGIEHISWYDLFDDGADLAYNEYNFGIARNDYSMASKHREAFIG